MKTAALIRCACRMGAICTDAPPRQLEALTTYATNLGLAFQIADDILDETSTSEQLGKATQKDAAAGKLTYPGVFGLTEAGREAGRLIAEAKDALVTFGDRAENLRALADYVVSREN